MSKTTKLFAARIITSILLICPLSLAVALAEPQGEFPAAGTPYAKARALLIGQGIRIAPDKPSRADIEFHELDCQRNPCSALFLKRRPDGWQDYVIVLVDPKKKTVTNIDYAHTADGLPSIPPPRAADIPKITGRYLPARSKLSALGFKPAAKRGNSEDMCEDISCRTHIPTPEAECSGTGVASCSAYWFAKDGRVLKVTTQGEINPRIYNVEWITRRELAEFLGQ